MPAEKKSKNNKRQVQSVTDVTIDSLKKMLDKNDFGEFRNLVLGNYNNPQWLKSIGGENKNTQPTISFVGGIILQDAIMKIFKSMKANMFDKKRLEYFKSPVFVENFMTEIKHIIKISDDKSNDQESLEYGKWILDVFNACFKVRDVYSGSSAGAECQRVLWKSPSGKEAYMQSVEKECYICQRPWLRTAMLGNIPTVTCDGTGILDQSYVHCEHIVPFLAALYHVKLARSGDSLNDPILDTQYALAHKGCNELKADYQMYMKASELKLQINSIAVGNKGNSTKKGGTTIINVQDGGDGVITRAQAKAIIENGVAPDRLINKVKKFEEKQKKQPGQQQKQPGQQQIDKYKDPEFDNIASEFKFMYIPNMEIIKELYTAIVEARHKTWGVDKLGNPIKFNSNSVLLNSLCKPDISISNVQWGKSNNYPILPRLRTILRYINTNIDKLRINNIPEEQLEILYDLWCKFKLIFSVSPNKLDQIFSYGEIVDKKGTTEGGGVQVGGAESDYDIMKGYIGESVKELFGNEATLNIPLRITGRFKLILGMTEGLNANDTYYEFKMTDRDGRFLTSTTETNKMVENEDTVPSVRTIKKIHETVDGIYKYTYDTKNNLKYLQKVDTSNGKLQDEKFFIMKDPTNSEIYAVEYVNFGEITNTSGNKTFGVYTVFSKDTTGRSISSGGGDTRDNDVESEYNDDNDENDENEDDVRYANFRRVSKTLRVNKQKHGKTLSKNSKTFKKR